MDSQSPVQTGPLVVVLGIEPPPFCDSETESLHPRRSVIRPGPPCNKSVTVGLQQLWGRNASGYTVRPTRNGRDVLAQGWSLVPSFEVLDTLRSVSGEDTEILV